MYNIILTGNQNAIRRILDHPFVSAIILLILIIVLFVAFKFLITSGMESWKKAKVDGTNKWAAIGGEIAMGLVVIVVIVIVAGFTMSQYVDFLRPLIDKILEFLKFIWDLFF